MTEGDLEKLGIPLGDRKRLIKAIKSSILAASPPAPITNAEGQTTRTGQPHAAVAERRQLTIMICDLVGSTALSARLDPEDMSAVLLAFQSTCSRIVASYDGFIGDFRGDGILAYFGYPRAHENDAERSVRAGLDIVASVARLQTQAAEPLAVRVGIATGLVVVGEGELRAHAIVGDAPNLAARLQSLAEPGKIVVAASTRRLLGKLFRLTDLGRHQAKGFSKAIEAWAVEGVSDSGSRFEAVRMAGLTDLIGREDQLDLLLERQRLAWTGAGQIVLISGEPGVGKSRLAIALAERSRGTPCTHLHYQCSPNHANSVLYPVISHFERAARFKADDTPEQRLDKLENLLALEAPRLQAVAPLMASLLSIPFGRRYPELTLKSDRATPENVCGIARTARRFGPATTDLLAVRGHALGRRHLARTARPGCRSHTQTANPCTVHVSVGIRTALAWHAQRASVEARPARLQGRRSHALPTDRRPPPPA